MIAAQNGAGYCVSGHILRRASQTTCAAQIHATNTAPHRPAVDLSPCGSAARRHFLFKGRCRSAPSLRAGDVRPQKHAPRRTPFVGPIRPGLWAAYPCHARSVGARRCRAHERLPRASRHWGIVSTYARLSAWEKPSHHKKRKHLPQEDASERRSICAMYLKPMSTASADTVTTLDAKIGRHTNRGRGKYILCV